MSFFLLFVLLGWESISRWSTFEHTAGVKTGHAKKKRKKNDPARLKEVVEQAVEQKPPGVRGQLFLFFPFFLTGLVFTSALVGSETELHICMYV